MPSKKTVAIVGAALVASASVVTVLSLRRQKNNRDEEDEEAFSPVTSPSYKKTVSEPAKAPKPEKVSTPAVASVEKKPIQTKQAPPVADNAADLLDEALNELEPKSVPPPTTITTTASTDAQEIPHLGLAMKVPSGWEVREELSPVPNVAMVTVWNPEFANMPNAQIPGAVPVMILSVEDIRGENLNLTEFKDRSKDLSLQQMLMMTGGAVQPMVRKDTSIKEGPFRHVLEYAQSMPPFFDIYVINLLEVRNGVAYVFQIMCNPKVMNEYKSIFMDIARDTVITQMETSALGYLEVHTGKVALSIDSTWTWSLPKPNQDQLITMELASTVKKEEIALYESDKVPITNHTVRNEKVVDDVTIISAFDGSEEKKIVSYGKYSFVVRPLQKAISYLSEASLIQAIKTVHVSDTAPLPKNGATFFAPEYGYRFNVVGGSRVISTRLGNGTVVYAPDGIPQDLASEAPSEQQGPTVTIRIGNPDDDPDCMGSFDEWHSRILAEAQEGNISDIHVTTMKGEQCLSFVTKEMQEVGPGQKLEIKGNAYIFVRGGVTTIVRWETSSGQWMKYESQWNTFLQSFEFL